MTDIDKALGDAQYLAWKRGINPDRDSSFGPYLKAYGGGSGGENLRGGGRGWKWLYCGLAAMSDHHHKWKPETDFLRRLAKGEIIYGNGSLMWPLINRLSRENRLRVIPVSRYQARIMRVTTGGVVDTSRGSHPRTADAR